MSGVDWVGTGLAVLFIFIVSDVAYTLDHYFVHHDRKRYVTTHGRHHRRYNGLRAGAHLDAYELGTYNSAGIMSCLGTSVLTLYTGNPGFLLGAVLKWAHSLLFHLYQHRWWGDVPVGKLGIPRPGRRWGLATPRYHAFHHSNPDDDRFTYSESWTGLDRILERLHPWLYKYTVDGRAEARARAEGRETAPSTTVRLREYDR